MRGAVGCCSPHFYPPGKQCELASHHSIVCLTSYQPQGCPRKTWLRHVLEASALPSFPVISNVPMAGLPGISLTRREYNLLAAITTTYFTLRNLKKTSNVRDEHNRGRKLSRRLLILRGGSTLFFSLWAIRAIWRLMSS